MLTRGERRIAGQRHDPQSDPQALAVSGGWLLPFDAGVTRGPYGRPKARCEVILIGTLAIAFTFIAMTDGPGPPVRKRRREFGKYPLAPGPPARYVHSIRSAAEISEERTA